MAHIGQVMACTGQLMARTGQVMAHTGQSSFPTAAAGSAARGTWSSPAGCKDGSKGTRCSTRAGGRVL